MVILRLQGCHLDRVRRHHHHNNDQRQQRRRPTKTIVILEHTYLSRSLVCTLT